MDNQSDHLTIVHNVRAAVCLNCVKTQRKRRGSSPSPHTLRLAAFASLYNNQNARERRVPIAIRRPLVREIDPVRVITDNWGVDINRKTSTTQQLDQRLPPPRHRARRRFEPPSSGPPDVPVSPGRPPDHHGTRKGSETRTFCIRARVSPRR